MVMEAKRRQIIELAEAGVPLKRIEQTLNVTRPTITRTLREATGQAADAKSAAYMENFKAIAAARRERFERAWNDNEPWIRRFVKNWNPPAGVL